MLEALISQFARIEDPRCEWKVDHKLIDVLVILVCAVRGEAESFEGHRAVRPLQAGLAAVLPRAAGRHPLARHLPPRADADRPGALRALLSRLGPLGVPARSWRSPADRDRRQDSTAVVRPLERPLAPAPGQRVRGRAR